ncbi:MAG: aminotransferase class V-fold PLP-dependent enzyme [Alphaproteobacteria bacterium]|nr:aminotransferase class V-fold PLP-dependent enzyme [Alphaproteobacteria bacterium]
MIHLDHAATSPLHPAVRAAMEPWWGVPCNPSSVHTSGRRAAAAVERAAEQVAALVGKRATEVVFTSGATEANVHWFHAMRAAGRAGRVAIGATEHPSVRAAAGGCEVLAVDAAGRHGPLPSGIDGLSVQAVNHETGVITDLAALREGGGWRHVDATAGAGRIPLDLAWADGVTLSAHKLGGPLGVGALIAVDTELAPLLPGTQQRGRRGGTLNTPGIVGFGEAARLARVDLEARRALWARCEARIVALVEGFGGGRVGGHTVPSVVNVVFPGLPAEAVVQALDLRGIAASAGSACASGSVGPSPVLEAMGHPEPDGGVRFSLGWSTTEADVDALESALPAVLEGLRAWL